MTKIEILYIFSLMKTVKALLVVVGLGVLLTSCVSMKKYRDTKARLLWFEHNNSNLTAEAQQLREQRQALEAQYEALAARWERDGVRHEEIQALLKERNRMLLQIREILDDVLADFSDQGLSVTERDGMIYVSMEEDLLFESGMFEVSEEGEKAILKLAKVLQDHPNIKIMVEGHTDDVPYRFKPKEQIVDNWDLSVHRATSVIRILSEDGGVDEERITASGRSQYAPVAAGSTAEARRKNRRTEIILMPDMERLMDVLNEVSQLVEEE